jgi:hypothetical protein
VSIQSGSGKPNSVAIEPGFDMRGASCVASGVIRSASANAPAFGKRASGDRATALAMTCSSSSEMRPPALRRWSLLVGGRLETLDEVLSAIGGLVGQ